LFPGLAFSGPGSGTALLAFFFDGLEACAVDYLAQLGYSDFLIIIV
jgi:hypothetical protein